MSDLISRSALMVNKEQYRAGRGEYSCMVDTWYIENAPAVDAVPVVHGRWKYYHKQNIAVCTNCSFERDLDANFGRAISCPNCGADMRGDESEK